MKKDKLRKKTIKVKMFYDGYNNNWKEDEYGNFYPEKTLENWQEKNKVKILDVKLNQVVEQHTKNVLLVTYEEDET